METGGRRFLRPGGEGSARCRDSRRQPGAWEMAGVMFCEPQHLYNIINQCRWRSRLSEPNYLCLLGEAAAQACPCLPLALPSHVLVPVPPPCAASPPCFFCPYCRCCPCLCPSPSLLLPVHAPPCPYQSLSCLLLPRLLLLLRPLPACPSSCSCPCLSLLAVLVPACSQALCSAQRDILSQRDL